MLAFIGLAVLITVICSLEAALHVYRLNRDTTQQR